MVGAAKPRLLRYRLRCTQELRLATERASGQSDEAFTNWQLGHLAAALRRAL